MPINVSSKTKSDPVPAGTHHAVCYGVIAVGTQPSEKFTPRPKIIVCFEIPSERITLKIRIFLGVSASDTPYR